MVVTRRRALMLAGALGAGLLTAGCSDPTPGAPDTKLTIGLTYVPNVQFAPFYLAVQQGYFTEAGVDVTLRHHGDSEDLFGALTGGREQIVVAGGDEMLQARAQGTDVISVATMYQTYPVVLIVPEGSDITAPEHLAGRTVGIPGPYGETYFGLLAMLKAAGLTEADLTISNIGYTQQAALSGGHVDAVMGYVNNDVPQFRATGLAVSAVGIGDVPLVGIGLGTTSRVTQQSAAGLRGVIEAVGRAVADIAADPNLAVEAASEEIPGTITDEQRAIMTSVAEATVPLYGDLTQTWGQQDPERWQAMSTTMLELGLIESEVDATTAFTNDFLATVD
ncbi:ABC transporter substrate-binding protein [Pseudactinotalea terrae]|uniref:ABC transporter substrate-binding protein n=1 Tax=Pseudactinotalea terrae TaxID=1743262 RepID=UPI0012E116B5|nr:ABC transporter substrate-binding protein [Pseudactinotalea terrae]